MRERGFTLIEVIIVAGAVAIMAAVVFTNVSEARKKGRDVQRMSDLAQLQIALKLYNDVYGTYNVDGAIQGGEGWSWVSHDEADDGADDGGVEIIELPGPIDDEKGGEDEIGVPIKPIDVGQEAQLIGIELPGPDDSKEGVSIDQALYNKGFLPSPVLRDPSPSSRDDHGYIIALCDEGRRYAVYATKEIPTENDLSNTTGLCDGEDDSFGSGAKGNLMVQQYGKNYGVGN